MKRKKKVILIVALLLILSIGLLSAYLILGNNEELKVLEVQKSLVTKQYELEKNYSAKGYTIEEPKVVLNPYGNSPLTALVLFETEEEVEPTIIVEGKSKLTTFKNTFSKSKEHYLPIYGLYPDKENIVIINFGDVTKEIKIKTEKLPEDFILPTNVKKDESKLTNDLYFFTPSSKGYTCAYDVNGDVRWYLTNYALWKIDRLENGHMLVSTERLINSPYYMTGLYEVDLLGKIYNEYNLPGGYHHDYYEMENGNLLIASDEFNNDDGTVEDIVVEIDRKSGKIIKTFDIKDVLNMTDGKSENWIDYDWFHNNSVWYDEKTESITLSGRHQDAVINISYETGKLNWIIGDPTNWSEDYQKYFFTPVGKKFEWQWSQHAAMVTPEGYIFILDNGNNKSKIKEEYVSAENSYTRGVMYKIDTEKMTIEQIWQYGKERGSDFYSPYISDVDYLAKNHYIVHSGGIVYVDRKNSNQPAGFSKNTTLVSDTVELLNNKVIFELTLPTNNYRVEKMPLYIDSEFKLGKANYLGTLGETKVTETKKGKVSSKENIESVTEKHNIKFTNQEDRLTLTGQFIKGTKVNLILVQNKKQFIYNVSISKKPYTALCVDIMTEEETENGLSITKHINKEGLSGEYSIYLEIDGTIYSTGLKFSA